MSKETTGKETDEMPAVLPLLPVRDLVVFPYMIAPLRVSRKISLEAVQDALSTEERLVFIVAQRDSSQEDPDPSTLYRSGTVGVIMRMRRLSDGSLKILVQGLSRARVERFLTEQPYFKVRLDHLDEVETGSSVEVQATARSVRQNVEKIAELGKTLQPELAMVLQNVEEPGRIADLVAANLTLKLPEAQALLETDDPVARLQNVNEALEREIGILEVQSRIQTRAKEEMSKTQRDYFLREQMRQIRNELGDTDVFRDEIEELRVKIEGRRLDDEARREAGKQLKRLEMMSPESAESAVIRNYLDWLVEIPWQETTDLAVDLVASQKILDDDHHGLEHIKERIIDFLAVHKLRADGRGPLLCFLGPPGVGKTSLGRSIARALGRNFVRISLGGVRDEAEIRGHRRTYVGAMPGRIIQGMKQAGSKNPVFLLDELDKLGADFRGDPSAALLEVLDPEQNFNFRDHYLGVSYDLSKVMFIATANMIDGIPGPLRDRMEILRLSGYSEEEKLAIAQRYLVPKQVKEAGLDPSMVKIGPDILRRIVTEYTREAGLRELERLIARVGRKLARRVVEAQAQEAPVGKKARKSVKKRGTKPSLTVELSDIQTMLGPPRFLADERRELDEVGVANGLAWTSVGGEVLTVEAQMIAGKGQLVLTGQLGDVMKESAHAALSYARAQALHLGLRDNFYHDREIHIHVPAGGVPKDGPSAGITMAVVLASLVSGIPVRQDVAMTGELTLRGRVLPIGGLKEKLLAAARAGMKIVIIPHANAPELVEVPDNIRAKMKIIPIRTMDEALAIALVRPIIEPVKSEGRGRRGKDLGSGKIATKTKRRAAHA
ncbi:MAG: endopeptidase La [Deltaproteobacteria bacterium]|nr:endopeptidase La [Deltaproteobacteria bacterium]